MFPFESIIKPPAGLNALFIWVNLSPFQYKTPLAKVPTFGPAYGIKEATPFVPSTGFGTAG